MFPTFSGTSRRPRQVNLSGRNSNPFAAVQQSPHAAHGPTSAVAQAQQERRARQQERERLHAARVLQRMWKNHSGREHVKGQLRQDWDEQCRRLGLEGRAGAWQGPVPEEETLGLLRYLCQFASPQDSGDQERVALFSRLYVRLVPPPSHSLAGWLRPVQRLSRTALLMASRLRNSHQDHENVPLLVDFIQLLVSFAHHFSTQFITSYDLYYSVLGELLNSTAKRKQQSLRERLELLACLPLLKQPPAKAACRNFCFHILTTEALLSSDIRALLDSTSVKLSDMMLEFVLGVTPWEATDDESTDDWDFLPFEAPANHIIGVVDKRYLFDKRQIERLLRFLRLLILEFHPPRAKDTMDSEASHDVQDSGSSSGQVRKYSPPDGPQTFRFMRAVAEILNHIAGELQEGLYRTLDLQLLPVPVDVQKAIESLIDGQGMVEILRHLTNTAIPSREDPQSITHAADFASFILALLRWFPQRRNDIRQFLYTTAITLPDQHIRMSTVKYFWLAFAGSPMFSQISQSPTRAVEMMRSYRSVQNKSHETTLRAGEWRIALLFFDLYSFALKILDDHEFIHGADAAAGTDSLHEQSALRLQEVQSLIVALKNLAFATYFRSSDILGKTESENQSPSLAQLFGNAPLSPSPAYDKARVEAANEVLVPGIPWANMPYIKHLVTGILRALYDRE